jgi:hypothetical protein
MAQQTDASGLTDEELVQRIKDVRQGVEDGTIPLWTGNEALSVYLDRARNVGR